jgi:hypothetical protein
MATSFDLEHVQPHAGLLDLPTETILQIIENLTHLDLLSLAVLCRRLHYIALPFYFQGHGVQNLQGNLKVAFHDRSLQGNYLPGIRIALFLDSAREIEVIFRRSPYFFRDMKEAAYLVSRFTRLDHVKLNFLYIRDEKYTVPMVGPYLSDLLDAISAKSCKSFTILHGYLALFPGQSLDLAQETTSARHNRDLGPTESGPPVPNLTSPPFVCLRALQLNSNFFMWYPFVEWTLQTLARSSASLVELSLHPLSLPSADWAYFLPSISLPLLSKLSLAADDLNFSDLVLFLRRHPHLTTLCLCHGRLCTSAGGPVIPPEIPEPLPPGLFLTLTRLCGPSDYIVHLLRDCEQFPHLVDIDIRAFRFSRSLWERQKKQNEALALVKQLPVERQIRLTIILFGASLDSVQPVPATKRQLRNVRSLNLRVCDLLLMKHDPAVIARWLALYPSLRELTFLQKYFDSAFNESRRCAFVEQIAVAHPKIEHVAFGQDRRSVGNWRNRVH